MRKLLPLLFVASLSSAGFAQSIETSAPKRSEMGTSSEGFRVSIFKSVLHTEVRSITNSGMGVTSNPNIDADLGLALGYAYLPIQTLGFTGSAAYMGISSDSAGS